MQDLHSRTFDLFELINSRILARMNNSLLKIIMLTVFVSLGKVAVAMEAQDILLKALENRESVFPDILSYEQMKELGGGQALTLSGFEIRAVKAEIITSNMPGALKQFGRSTLARVGLATQAGAHKFGGVKDRGNIVIQGYIYEPAANMGTTFQFSVYYIEPLFKADTNESVLDEVTKRDLGENLKFIHGSEHHEVKLHLLQQKEAQIRETQLAPVNVDYARFKALYNKAFARADSITAEYLQMIMRKIETQIAAIEMKLHFLTQTAPTLFRADETLSVEDVFSRMEDTIVINAYASKLHKEAIAYKMSHREHIEAALAKD